MISNAEMAKVADAAAEEVLRVIYGDDLEGCAVRVDSVAAVIRSALDGKCEVNRELAELHLKGFEAIRLLSTPPLDGAKLSGDELRSLLSDRLDKIQNLSSRIIAATKTPKEQQ